MKNQMRNQSKAGASSWGPEDVLELARWRFLPNLKSEDILWLGMRSGKKGRGKLAELVKPRAQTITFAQWVGVGDDLWNDHRWRGCLMMRYHHGDIPAISCLPADWKSELESAASEFRKWEGPDQLTSDRLEAKVSQSIPHELLNDAYFRLGFEYIDALLTGQWSATHRLNLPLSKSGLFNRVFERADRDYTPELRQYRDNRHMLVIGIPGGHVTEPLGRVCYYLLLLEYEGAYFNIEIPDDLKPIWPARLNLDKFVKSDDFGYVARLYAKALGVDFKELLDTRIAYLTVSLKAANEDRAASHQTVFWASRILRCVDRGVFGSYVEWVKQFRKSTLDKMRSWRENQAIPATERWATLSPWLSSLDNDALLNCVFHSICLDGDNRLMPLKPRGRPANRVEGVTIGFAVRKLKSLIKSKRVPTPRSILTKNGAGASKRVRDAAELADDRSVYSYAAPLVTSMMPPGSWIYTPSQVREIWRHYANNEEVLAIQRNILRNFADVAWVKRPQ